jgi:hypothetical protein
LQYVEFYDRFIRSETIGSPQGNRHMRRLLNQAIGSIAHRQYRLIWLILHRGVRYEERGPAVTKQSKQKRTTRMIRQLRSLGYRIDPPNPQPNEAQA